jgi:8-oxo-dGTP diphosphatase
VGIRVRFPVGLKVALWAIFVYANINFMKLLLTINPINVTTKRASKFRVRKAARAVVVDKKGNIALLHVRKNNYYKLPGGGIENSENIATALKRECIEEIGCQIKIGSEIGRIIEYRTKFNLKQISYCYRAKVIGKKSRPSFTKSEQANKFKLEWVTIKNGLKVLENYNPDDYEGKFIRERDLTFLRNY